MIFQDNHDPSWIPDMRGPFADELAAYIRHKRALGFGYTEPTCRLFSRMDEVFAAMGADGTCITKEMVDTYCAIKPGQSKATLSKRRSAINGFSDYLASKGWADVARCDDWQGCGTTFAPYVFDHDEISCVFEAAHRRTAGAGERPHAFYTALCLYYTCGLRRSEAMQLRVGDFDRHGATVRVEMSKNGVTRLVALSDSTATVVAEHVDMLPDPSPGKMLLREGRSQSAWSRDLYAFWHAALEDAGVPLRADGSRPRIHDLRHSFCVHALEKIAQGGRDIRAALPLLSTYLGHKSLTETEYYLRLTEEAYREVASAAEAKLPRLYEGGRHAAS
ncbi:MAG: tyrosine-type recombinase/integrase [Eggerthellaceae bacterium]|nr:tyrosine-type recombinase/integrase [Eggerthellaceae bacterium]